MKQQSKVFLFICLLYVVVYFLVQRHLQIKYGVAPQIKFHTNETIGATFSKGAYVYAQNMTDPETHGSEYNELLRVLDNNFWDIDTDLSDKDATVYVPREVVGPDGNDPMPANARAIVIAYRGTDIYSMSGDRGRDFKSDFFPLRGIALGSFSYNNRVKHGVQKFVDVERKYPGFYISLTGHSLGGSVADQVTRYVGNNPVLLQTQTFDKGVGFEGTRQGFQDYLTCRKNQKHRPEWCDKVSFERARNDIVSGGMGGWAGMNVTTYDIPELMDVPYYKQTAGIRAHDIEFFENVETERNLNRILTPEEMQLSQSFDGGVNNKTNVTLPWFYPSQGKYVG